MPNNCDQCEKARQPPTEVFTTGGAQFVCTKNEVREQQDLPVTSNWQDGTRGGDTVILVWILGPPHVLMVTFNFCELTHFLPVQMLINFLICILSSTRVSMLETQEGTFNSIHGNVSESAQCILCGTYTHTNRNTHIHKTYINTSFHQVVVDSCQEIQNMERQVYIQNDPYLQNTELKSHNMTYVIDI